MKQPTGYAKPRRSAPARKRVRLDLKRRPLPAPEDPWVAEQKSNFGKWVGLVALFHVVVIGAVWWLYESSSRAKPPEQFVSLLPAGEIVKGTPGPQEAHKTGSTTPAPAHHISAPPPTLTIHASKPTPPKRTPPKPVVKMEAPPLLADKPIVPAPPVPPKLPKVKVDLTLADAPATATDKPKPKIHHKKPPPKPTDDTEDQPTAATSESTGLSKEQIAAKLGEKLDAEGIKNATNLGKSGASNANQNQFSEFYQMIAEQVKDKWEGPNFSDEAALSPVVHIYVEKDGRVPPETVYLMQSSGNTAYDNSSLAAAKSLGYLREPLPEGCLPDITIHIHPY
jgi:hypothetical protein